MPLGAPVGRNQLLHVRFRGSSGQPFAALLDWRHYLEVGERGPGFAMGAVPILNPVPTPPGPPRVPVEGAMVAAYTAPGGGTHVQIGFTLRSDRAPQLADVRVPPEDWAAAFDAIERAAGGPLR